MIKKIDLSIITDIKKILSEQPKTVIIGHHNPDGDAMGAGLGLYNFLSDKISDLQIVMPSAHAENMNWLPNIEKVKIFDKQKDEVKEIFKTYDVIFCVDFNTPSRIGDKMKSVLEKSKAIKILLDHHPQPDKFANYIISDTSVSSASEVVYEFIEQVFDKPVLNIDTATCLFTGIMTDTLCFSVNSSKKRTFEITGELLSYDINKDKIYNSVYNNYSEDRMKLFGYVLDKKMEIIPGTYLSYFSLSIEEQKKYNFKHGDSDGFVNAPLSIKGIFVSVFFKFI